jgi:hypothetical protein
MFSIFAIFGTTKIMVRERLIMTPIVTLVYIGILIFGAFQPQFLSSESTQEISCFLNQFHPPEYGFFSNCFLGYPSRQFIIPSIPTLVFGRSLWTLQIGNSLYMLMGIPVFLYGLLRYFHNVKHKDILLACTLATLFHFGAFTKAVFLYEQSGYPVGFAFFLTGLWLLYVSHPSFSVLAMIGAFLHISLNAYTPALALLFGSAGMLLGILFAKHLSRLQRIAILWMLVLVGCSFFCTLSTRSDIRIISPQTYQNMVESLVTGWHHILFITLQIPFTSPYVL